jgi:hypothetical protein
MMADRSDTAMVAPTPQLPTQSDRLLPNQGLIHDERITSLDGRFELYLQATGNLVLGGPQGQSLWTSNTAGDSVVIMQPDGNLVIFYANGTALWSSSTLGNPDAFLVAQNDGNLVIYSANNQSLWDTKSFVPATPIEPTEQDRLLSNQGLTPGGSINSTDDIYSLSLQSDGNLVLSDAQKNKIWAADTSGNIWDVVMEGDGNLVVYDANGQSAWSSNTPGNNNSMLVVQDGKAVIYNPENVPIWSRGINTSSTTTLPIPSSPNSTASSTGLMGPSSSVMVTPSYPGGHLGAILGGVGGVLGCIILILLGLCIYLWSSKRRERANREASVETGTASGMDLRGNMPSGNVNLRDSNEVMYSANLSERPENLNDNINASTDEATGNMPVDQHDHEIG